jgi:hypothetical protein
MHPPPPVVASVVPLPLLVADTAPVLLSVVLVLVLVGGVVVGSLSVVPEPSVGLTEVVPVEPLPDSEALSVATGSLS